MIESGIPFLFPNLTDNSALRQALQGMYSKYLNIRKQNIHTVYVKAIRICCYFEGRVLLTTDQQVLHSAIASEPTNQPEIRPHIDPFE